MADQIALDPRNVTGQIPFCLHARTKRSSCIPFKFNKKEKKQAPVVPAADVQSGKNDHMLLRNNAIRGVDNFSS
jgi:hypothetical protein